jgi:homoserine O-acetyltransferase
MGVELDEMCLVQCVGRGLDVVQADLNRAMPGFGDGQFDCVVLSQTLQAVRDVERLIGEMLRIGRRAIVSFPNFAHRPLRESFERTGRMPRTALMPDAWYATANVRFLTILDFVDFCRERGLVVERQVALDTEAGRVVAEDRAADDADLAIFMIRRGNTTA